jgi:hypothetical protein
VTIGNDITDGTKGVDGESTYILGHALPAGFVHKFNVYLETTDPILLQVFRPLGGNAYKLINEVEVAQNGAGDYRVGRT